MRDRWYTFLLAVLPRKQQGKLYNKLLDRYGYHGFTKIGNGTMRVSGTAVSECDYYRRLKRFADQMEEGDGST